MGETENTLIISAIFLVYYLLYGVLVYRVAKRIGMPDAWMGFVPILNIFLVWEMSRRGAFFGFMILLLGILSCGFFGGILLAVAWGDIAKRVGRSPWYGYATIIPVVGIVTLWLMGEPRPIPAEDRDYRLRANHEDDLSTRLYAGEAAGAYIPTLSQAVGPPSQVTPALQDTMVDFGGLSGTGEAGGESRLKSLGKCPNCNSANRDGAMFCNHCGEPIFAEGAPPEAEPRAPGPVDLYGPGQPGAFAQVPAGWPPQGPGQYYPRDINVRTPPGSTRRKGGYGWVGAALAGCVVLGLLAFTVISFMQPSLKVGPPPGWRSATGAEWDIIDGQMNGRLDAESLFVPETVNPYVNTIIVVKVVDLPLMPEVPDTGDLEVMKAYVNDHRGDFRLGEEFSDKGASERIESVEAVRMDCGQCALLVRSWTTYAEMGVVEDVIITRKGKKTYGIIVTNVVGANNDLEVTHLLKNVRFD